MNTPQKESVVIDFNAAKARIIEKRLKVDEELLEDDISPEEFCDGISSQLIGDLVSLIYSLDMDIVSKEGTVQDIMLIGEAVRAMFNRQYDIPNELHSVSESLFTLTDKEAAIEHLLNLAEEYEEF